MDLKEPVDVLSSVCSDESKSVTVTTKDTVFNDVGIIRAEPKGTQRELFFGVGPGGVQFKFEVNFSITGSIESIVLFEDETAVGKVESITVE